MDAGDHQDSWGRREFLSHSTKALVAAGAALSSGGIASSQGLPGHPRPVSANEKIVMGGIGLGGRGADLMKRFVRRGDVVLKTVCDVNDRRGNDLMLAIEEEQEFTPRRVRDYKEILDDREIDAVIIATPDHWHAPMTVSACQAGKDVYVEKPPTHNIWEGRKMVEAARKYGHIVQVGTQNRSAPYIRDAHDYIQQGGLGEIHLCKVYNLKPGGPFTLGPDDDCPSGLDWNTWLGPAAKRPYNRDLFYGGWHMFWDYSGGDMADDGMHQLDIARMLVGKEFPKSVYSNGGNLAFPHDDREVPDTLAVTYDFDGLVMTFELTQYTPYMTKTPGSIRGSDRFPAWLQNSTRIELYGSKRMMVVGRHGGGWQVFTNDGEVVTESYGRHPDPEHKENFVQCIRSRQQPNADPEEGHRSACLVHLGCISLRVGGRKLLFDPQTETIVNDEEANRLVRRTYREPFVIPEAV